MRGYVPDQMPLWDDAPNVSGPQVPLVWRVPEGPGIPVGQRSNTRNHAGPGCGAGGRRQGLAGLRDDAPSEARGADGERAGRRPRAHQADRYQQVLLTATRNLAASQSDKKWWPQENLGTTTHAFTVVN